MAVILEVCLEGIDSALAAQEGGAQRIELCAGLVEGGTTPSFGMMVQARDRLELAIHAIIRPRGGDSCYSEAEFAVMEQDISFAKDLGLDGVVFGVQTADGRVDRERTAALINLARPLSVTFHRAFDHTPDPFEALDVLADLGADRVLTSGQAPTVSEGLELICRLQAAADGRLKVMPGSGIDIGNAAEIIKSSGVAEIHVGGGVAEVVPERSRVRNPEVPMSASNQGFERRTSAEKVRELVGLLNSL
ncbi:MAG: copper homeostasis protein CutC [Anaerolineales bacterium]|nr:copper homeostasis protein CutC [Anaerolineales bacterium]